MTRINGVLLFGWLCFLLTLGDGASADPILVVNRPQVNIRADATVQAPRIAVLGQGEELERLRRKDEWYQVQLPDGRNGWININLVLERFVVTDAEVPLRLDARVEAAILTMLVGGESLTRLERRGDWLQVQAGDGRVGWVPLSRVRAKTRADQQASPRPVTQRPTPIPAVVEAAPVEVEDEPVVDADEVSSEAILEASPTQPVVRRDPYARGLQYKREGDHEAALASFAAVLAQDPDNLNALFHIAEVHKQIGQHEEALGYLYHALEVGGPQPDARYYLVLGDVYRLLARPDSARKYQALFRGEKWIGRDIASQMTPVPTPPPPASRPFALGWLLVAAAGGAVLLAGVAFFWWRRGGKGGGFADEMEHRADEALEEVGAGEEEELDRQIDEKWEALRQSASAFTAGAGAAAAEEAQLDRLLDQMDALRGGLGQQDERARLYAEIVRLQNMKIEALKDEISLLRRQRGKG